MDEQGDLPLPAGMTDDLEAVTAAADDFGHTVHRVPSLVAKPGDDPSVVEVARYAHGAGLALVPSGARHSADGQAQSDGGIVCDMAGLASVAIGEPDSRTASASASISFSPAGSASSLVSGSAWVSAEAGATWSAVLDAALAYGLTPPVLPDYMELSVGGTLSVGGIGGASHVYGPVVDQVRSLDVVTYDGSPVADCSPDHHADVFFGALGTGGSGGIITSAELPLVPAPSWVRVHQIPCPDAGALVAAQLEAVREQQFGYVEGQISLAEDGGWEFMAELGVFLNDLPDSSPGSGSLPGDAASDSAGGPSGVSSGDGDVEDMTYRDFCHRMTPGVRLLAATGDWYRPHPWFSVFLPVDAVEKYVNAALAELTAATVGPLPLLLYPIRRGEVRAPGLVTPPVAEGELFYAFTILRTAETPETLAAALASNERLAQAALAVGGTVYRISALPTKPNEHEVESPAT